MNNFMIFLYQRGRDYGRINDLDGNGGSSSIGIEDLFIIVVAFFIFYLVIKIGANRENRRKEQAQAQRLILQNIQQKEFEKKEKRRKKIEAWRKEQADSMMQEFIRKEKERKEKKERERKEQEQKEHRQLGEKLFHPFIIVLCRAVSEYETFGDILEHFDKHTHEEKIQVIDKCKQSIMYMKKKVEDSEYDYQNSQENENILYILRKVRKLLKKDMKGKTIHHYEEFLPPNYDALFGHYPLYEEEEEENEEYNGNYDFEDDLPF